MAQLKCERCHTVGNSFGFVTFLGGYICKRCLANKSSRASLYNCREIRVQDAVEHLNNRAERGNLKKLFTADASVGDYESISVSLSQRKLMLHYEDGDYDIVDLDKVTAFQRRTEDEREEIQKRTINGMVSYSPKQYSLSTTFYVSVGLADPLMDDIDLQLCADAIESRPNIVENNDGGFGNGVIGLLRDVAGLSTSVIAEFDPMDNVEYAGYVNKLQFIEDAIFGRLNKEEKEPEPDRPQVKKRRYPIKAICPYCTASTLLVNNGCCEYCDSFIGELVAVEMTDEEYYRMTADVVKLCPKCKAKYSFEQSFCTACGTKLSIR